MYNRFLLLVFSQSEQVNIWQLLVRTSSSSLPLCSSPPPLGMFALSIAYSFLKYVQARVTWRQFRQLFIVSVMVSAGLVFAAVVGLTYAGVIAPWSGRFYSLYDTGLGRERVGVTVTT